jgi:photosystem II stability/assembly factor-like uncharacterized protein
MEIPFATIPRMRRLVILVAFLFVGWSGANAQWDIEESHTTASLRGIQNVGGGVAWASGTNGTVLRTEDGGYLWQTCIIPPGAEKLDFRGIQAFDENTAIVMSSGKGDLSRLYKTTDGCQTWKLLFTNPDKEGFWDAIVFTDRQKGFVLGDPLPISGGLKKYAFAYFQTSDAGETWNALHRGAHAYQAPPADPDDAVFAASNSSFLVSRIAPTFVTGGPHAYFIIGSAPPQGCLCNPMPLADSIFYGTIRLPLAEGKSAGAFSIATDHNKTVIVGGDYDKPEESYGTAAYQRVGTPFWQAAETLPHGFRSAVVYDPQQKLWITVGPNGTDISRDDGKNWSPLKPSPQDPPDADKDWNALSLPFVVGPHGRIGKLNPKALTP